MGAKLTATLAAGALTVALAGCGGGTSARPGTVTVHDTPGALSPSSAAVSPRTSPQVAARSASVQSWTMPNLIGKDLQSAQDAIQSLTNNAVWYSGSHDLTGRCRHQIMDRNWQVCNSTPAPGETFTTSTSITFGVVRIHTETCP
jgi:hypothetical protein